MPQTLVQKNGRWQLVGDDHSHDHAPPPPTTGPKPKTPAKKAPKPWWNDPLHAVTNELRWAAKQIGGFNAGTKLISGSYSNPLMGGDPVYYDTRMSPRNPKAYSGSAPTTRQYAAAVVPGAVQTAGEGVIALGQKVLAPGKYADPRRSPPGKVLNAITRTAYSVLGAKQPEDLTEGQRGVIDNLGRQAGVEIGTLPIGGALTKGVRGAIKGTTWASRGLRWGTTLGVTHGMGALLQDSTQGSIVNATEALTGIHGLPLAVDPAKDDRVTSAIKAFFPNLVGGELTGLAGSAGARAVGVGAKAAGKSLRAADSLIQKGAEWEANRAFKKWAAGGYDPRQAEKIARQFENISRYRRAAGANTTHVTAGEKLKARGLVEDIEGQQRFTEQALEKPAPVPIPQTPDEARDAVLARWGRGAQQPADQVRGATEMVTAPVEAPVPAAAPAAAEQSSATPAATAETAPLPDPWFYDPALPEVADAQKLVSQLDPAELQAVAAVGADGGPVLQHIEEVIASRPAPQPRPEISEGWAGIPTNRLSEIYLNGAGDLQPWSAQLDRLPATTLEELSHPEASPNLAQRIANDTGKTWPFSREEVINGMQALSADGTTIVPNRLRGDIRTMRTEDIYAAPQEFQYKEGINAQGEQLGQSLGGVERWDPNAEGVLQVFTDPRDGKTKVVNGHNRRALADRLGVPTLRVEEVNATTPAAARAAGAISNISAGNGTPFDAAKFIKSTGLTDQAQLQAAGIPLDKGWGRQGLALSRLPDDIFQQAVNGEHRLGRYVALGESGLDEPGMRGAYQVLKQRPKMTEDTFREVLDQAKQQGNVVAPSAQGGLFGDEVLNPMLQRAELVADVRSGLAKDRRLFGFATRNADALSEAGATTIDTAAAGQRVADAQQALGLFDTLKNQAGPVGELLSKGAERIAQGENASIVAKQIQREIGDSIERELASSGMKATPQDMAAPAPQPAPIPEPDRATLEAHAIQRAIANGEVRPTEMKPLELPPAPSADLEAVQRELAAMDPTLPLEEQLPNMPATRQAAADELRLAAEHARQDAEIAWAAEKAAREAEGYDLLSLQEKKAQGLGAEWVDPVAPEIVPGPRAQPKTAAAALAESLGGDELTYLIDVLSRAKLDGYDLVHATVAESVSSIKQDGFISSAVESEGTVFAPSHTGEHRLGTGVYFGHVNDVNQADFYWGGKKDGGLVFVDSSKLRIKEFQSETAYRRWLKSKDLSFPLGINTNLEKYLPDYDAIRVKFPDSSNGPSGFEVNVFDNKKATGLAVYEDNIPQYHPQLDAEKERLAAEYLKLNSKIDSVNLRQGLGALDPEALPPEPTGSIADLFEQQMRKMAESGTRLYRRAGEAFGNLRQGLDALDAGQAGRIASEVSGAPEFTLPPELAKSSPRYGRKTLQFESDLDRAAYVLANDNAKGGSKSANKFRDELIAAGLDPDQVAAHGKTVKEAIKAAARDTSGETVVVPVQDFAAGSPRLPLPEQQRQIDGTKTQIDDLQQKLNEGGCGT